MMILKKLKNRKIWLPLAAAALVAAAGLGYYFLVARPAATQKSTISYKTAQVRRGSIVISASGSGTLEAGQQTNLGFPISGKVASVNVQVGDRVTAGQTLAALEDLASLNASLSTAKLNLATAQKALDDLKNAGDANIGKARLTLATAEKAVTDAKSSLKLKGEVRCDEKTTSSYYNEYMRRKNILDGLGDGGGNNQYYLDFILPAKKNVDEAHATWVYCAGFTQYEIDSSNAQLDIDQAALKQAQIDLNTLIQNNGVDPVELAKAENNVASAGLTFEQAKKNLEGATMKAPFDGTVLSVAAQAGDAVGTGTFITLADLAHPQISFSVDETDMSKVAVGESADVVFDAVPGKTFAGKVTRVNPALVTSNNVQVLQGVVMLDEGQDTTGLIQGLNASVEIIGGRVQNALLVPLQALRSLGENEFGIFVLNKNNQPRLKVVEAGLMDLTYAEIKSGLQMGDVVTTGLSETK